MCGPSQQRPPVALRINSCRQVLNLVLHEHKLAADVVDEVGVRSLVGEVIGLDPPSYGDQPRPWCSTPLEAAGGLDGLDESLRGQIGDLLWFATTPGEERRHGSDVVPIDRGELQTR
jgi:hypothetical protein